MCPYHINDPEFANELVDSFLAICKNINGANHNEAISEPYQHQVDDSVSKVNAQDSGIVSYSLNDYPNAKPGCYLLLFPDIDDQNILLIICGINDNIKVNYKDYA